MNFLNFLRRLSFLFISTFFLRLILRMLATHVFVHGSQSGSLGLEFMEQNQFYAHGAAAIMSLLATHRGQMIPDLSKYFRKLKWTLAESQLFGLQTLLVCVLWVSLAALTHHLQWIGVFFHESASFFLPIHWFFFILCEFVLVLALIDCCSPLRLRIGFPLLYGVYHLFFTSSDLVTFLNLFLLGLIFDPSSLLGRTPIQDSPSFFKILKKRYSQTMEPSLWNLHEAYYGQILIIYILYISVFHVLLGLPFFGSEFSGFFVLRIEEDPSRFSLFSTLGPHSSLSMSLLLIVLFFSRQLKFQDPIPVKSS